MDAPLNVGRLKKELPPDVGQNFKLDENVRTALPAGSQVESSVVYGTAAWTRSARITVRLEDGSVSSYFLKCATEEQGKLMLQGEFEAMSAIYKINPALAPKPYAHGEFKEAPVLTYFFLMEFLEMRTGAPDPTVFCKQLAELHADSTSPNGNFGFHIITYHGPHPQNVTWEAKWSTFFRRLLRQFFERELNANGPDPEYEAEFERLEEVLPLILDPLQADGRQLKPSLCHGNLWEENCGTSLVEAGQPKIFDAGCFYGHNEYDIAMWRRDIIRFGRPHIRQYLRHMPPSEPRQQWDDRHRLYCIKYEIAHGIGWPTTYASQRQLIMRDMQALTAKYGRTTGQKV